MTFKFNWKVFLGVVLLALAWGGGFLLLRDYEGPAAACVMGGSVYEFEPDPAQAAGSCGNLEDLSARYQRPSAAAPLENPFCFSDFMEDGRVPQFEAPEEALYAYFGVLQNAANMLGYTGTCGTVGEGTAPYPYAYAFLSEERRAALPFSRFEESFAGIGHISFLKLYPAYAPEGTPEHIRYYMIELEVITGDRTDGADTRGDRSLFAYYYGIATLTDTEFEGWKIDNLQYIPEAFLCAPYHSWFYDSAYSVPIIYIENLKLFDRVTSTEERGGLIEITAEGGGEEYRLSFVRLTNGYDILLHEYVRKNGAWVETNLLPEQWAYFKLTADSRGLQSRL